MKTTPQKTKPSDQAATYITDTWQTLAAIARKEYQHRGRGFLVVNTLFGCTYANATSYPAEKDYTSLGKLVQTYNPETQAIILLVAQRLQQG